MNSDFIIFISYAHEDKHFVEEITRKLSSTGLSIWIDKEIHHGESISSRIVKAIDNSKYVLFFSSRNSNISDYCIGEVLVAIQKKKCVIPIKIDSTDYCDDLLVHLIRLHYVNFINGFSQEEYDELVSVLSCSFNTTEITIEIEGKEERKTNVNRNRWLVLAASVIAITIFSLVIGLYVLRKEDNKIQDLQTRENIEQTERFNIKITPGVEVPKKSQNSKILIKATSTSADIFDNDISVFKDIVNITRSDLDKSTTVTFYCEGKDSLIKEIKTIAEDRWHFEVEDR